MAWVASVSSLLTAFWASSFFLRIEELAGLAGEGVLGMSTVLGSLILKVIELGVEGRGHVLDLLLVVSTVLGHESGELLVLLHVLGVTLVTDLDHALELGSDLVVDLSLGHAVRLDGVGELGAVLVELGDLAASLLLEG